MKHTAILEFWFEDLSPADHFGGGAELDQKITDRFSKVLIAAKAGELWQWRETAEGTLAEVIVLDQFSRNINRGTAAAFAADAQALCLAQVAIATGAAERLKASQKLFLYMPFMHSESAIIHQKALELFTELGDEEALKYEHIHKDIVDRFGRYPHRNKQLDRVSTPEEISYLQSESEAFFNS